MIDTPLSKHNQEKLLKKLFDKNYQIINQMKVEIKYDDPDELRDIINDLKDYSEVKIIPLSVNTISVEYPDDWGVDDINNVFRIEDLIHLFYDAYLLTVIHDADVRPIEAMLLSGNVSYTISKKSITIHAANLILDYFQLVELIKKYALNFLLRPYKDIDYIKLSTDVSTFYKTLTTQQNLSLYELGLFSDVEIHVQGHIFKAHKFILATNSEHLFNILSYNPETDIIEINDDADLINDLLDLLYGKKIKIEGLKTLKLIQIILYFLVPNVDIEAIIKKIKIIPEFESNEYINLISKIYSTRVPNELIPYLKENITSRTNISNLPSITQQELKNSYFI